MYLQTYFSFKEEILLYEEETSQILYITCIIKEEKLNWMGI
jgi:hypothetical protein